jgi:hypothetical protein
MMKLFFLVLVHMDDDKVEEKDCFYFLFVV